MLRYFLVFFMLLSPVYIYSFYWNEGDNDFEDDESPASHRPSQVAYGGMTIECNFGCGDSSSNSSFSGISSILREAIGKVFSTPCSPLYLGWAPLEQFEAFPFHPWEREWPFKYRVYDWEKTKGFYLFENPRLEYSFTSYSQFLELASALRRDVRFYSLGVYEQELKFYRATLLHVQRIEEKGEYGNIAFDEGGKLELYGWGSSTSRSKDIC
jgi:hypothetical protein